MSILVARKAPDFTAPAVMPSGSINEAFSLSKEIEGAYSLVFFYPLDFTFVCPSELIALDHRMSAFAQRGIKVIAVSIDSHFTHLAWRNTPIEKGGIGPVQYPLVADISHSIIESYGIEHPEAAVALRGAFLIDKVGVVRSQIINDLPIGRNMDEVLRLFDAIQFADQHGEVCPANWKKGEEGMKASPDGVAEYLAEHATEL